MLCVQQSAAPQMAEFSALQEALQKTQAQLQATQAELQ
jgi:hypothetical protein